MLRRELLDPQRAWLDGLTLFEISDWTIAVLAAKFGPVAYLGDALSLYRQHAGGWWSLSRRTEQLALTITQYEWLRAHLPAAHAPMIRLQIAQHALEMSREFEERRDFRGAALALSRCLAERPPEFEHYLPQEGCFGKTVWRKLVWRAAMYRCVGVNYLAWRLRPLAADLRWRWARRREGLRTRLRQAAGQSVGWIRLRSQPVDSHERGALRSAELHWGASGTPEVVVTIGAPGGAIFSRTGPSGGATTGPWVHEGMVFYLQDVSAGRPLTAANTLASVRAKQQLPRPAPAPTDGVKSTREPNGKGTAERLDLFEVSAAVGALLGRHVSAIRLVSTETECLVCEASFGSRIAIVKAGLSPDTSTIALEAWALERARAAGVPVPRVLAVDTSRRSFPGDVMVIDRAAGRPLPDLHLSPANRDRLLVEFGRCIRLLHGITLPGYGTLDESIYRSEGCVRGHFPHWRDSVHWHLDHGLPYLEARGLLGETAGRSIRDLTLRRADLLEDIPAPSLLHGDLAWGHVFVDDSDSQVTSLIDFGNRQTGDPAWEFARLSIAEGPSCFEAVFKGYDPEGELSDRFRDRVPFYRVMLGLAVGRWLHEHGYHRDAVDLTADIAAALPGLLDGVQPGSPA
jgi:aminoglycoside phosphotransferase (APT) family kinase protein